VRLGEHPISGVEDLMYVLTESRPGTTMKALVVATARSSRST